MYGHQRHGIIRRNGFLYLANKNDYQLRISGDIVREFKHIAPEELAAGMLEILKHNVTADKNGLYRSLAAQCGVSRLGKSITESLDSALQLLENVVTIDGEQISFK